MSDNKSKKKTKKGSFLESKFAHWITDISNKKETENDDERAKEFVKRWRTRIWRMENKQGE